MVVMAAQTRSLSCTGKMDGGKLAFDATNTADKYDTAVKDLSETKGDF